jgi:hypothetical protein
LSLALYAPMAWFKSRCIEVAAGWRVRGGLCVRAGAAQSIYYRGK